MVIIIKKWYGFAYYYFAHAIIHGIVYDIVKQNENGDLVMLFMPSKYLINVVK